MVAAALLGVESHKANLMAKSENQKARSRDKLSGHCDPRPEPAENSLAEATRPVIELGDLTSGPEAELGRLKATLDQIRRENVRLTADNHKLTSELREAKLVLAKIHAKELQAIERRGSWMGSLNLTQDMFGKDHDKK